MEKVFVAKAVTAKLYSTEAAVDSALNEAAQLLAAMNQARVDLKVSRIFADDANVKLMAAMQALTEARTAMVGVHNELGEAQLRLGIRTKMDWSKPLALETEQTTLREVV